MKAARKESQKAVTAKVVELGATGVRNSKPVAASKWIRVITIDDKPFTLDFELSKLVDAEEKFNAQGHHRFNILFCLSIATLNLSRMRDLFAAAVSTHHPELTYAAALDLVTPETIYDISNAAYSVFLPAEEPHAVQSDHTALNTTGAA